MIALWEVIDMAKFDYEKCEHYPSLRHGYMNYVASSCLFGCDKLTSCLNYCIKKEEEPLRFRKYIREEVMKQMD